MQQSLDLSKWRIKAPEEAGEYSPWSVKGCMVEIIGIEG